MEEVPARKARDKMASLLNHVAFGKKRYMLTRHGKGIAVIISVEDWKSIESTLQKFPQENP